MGKRGGGVGGTATGHTLRSPRVASLRDRGPPSAVAVTGLHYINVYESYSVKECARARERERE